MEDKKENDISLGNITSASSQNVKSNEGARTSIKSEESLEKKEDTKKIGEKSDLTTKIKQKIVSFLKNGYNLAFLGVLILAFLIRLKYIGQESIWNDAALHLWYAIKVTKEPLFMFSQEYLGGDYTVVQTIMAFFYLFTKNAFLAGKIVAMLYALIGILFIYLLGTELKNKFTGLIAAAILSFNHLFWFYSVRPLGDSPLLVTTIVLLYCMIKLEKEKKIIWAIASGVTFLAAMFTKVQSSLFVFALISYYLLFKRKEMIKNKAILISWVIPVGFVLVSHVLAKLLFGAAILDRIFILFLARRGMPFGFEAAGMLKWIFSWYLIPFVVLGALFVILYRKKEYYFSIILFLFYWLFFEINVDNTQDRYMLPLLSVAVILAAFSLDELGSYISIYIHKSVKYFMVIGIVVLIGWNYYQTGDQLIYSKSWTYAGYQEAGQWIKENVPESSPLFAGEYRSIVLFSERELGGPDESERLGGSIWNLRNPRVYINNKSAFEQDVAEFSKKNDVYLEIDIWEYAQPSWFWPLTQDSLNYFNNLGFKLVKIVEREAPTKEGLKKMPVIFIFKKDKIVNDSIGN